MDHQEALRLQAVEKYILGELPPELREQFEEHYFDCSECAKDLKAVGSFVTASRLVLQDEEMYSRVSPHTAQATRPGWFNWLQPVISLPAIMALTAIVVFQMSTAIRSAKKQAAVQTVAEVYEASYRLKGATRGPETAKIAVRPDESFELDFDFIPNQTFPTYRGSLLDSSGQSVLVFGLKDEQRNKEVHVVIPGGKVRAGNYEVVVAGETENSNQNPKDNEVLRLAFAVVTESQDIQSGDHPTPPKE